MNETTEEWVVKHKSTPKTQDVNQNPDEKVWSLYLGCLLTYPDHFHSQCGCDACGFAYNKKDEYHNLTNTPLYHRDNKEVVLSGIWKVEVSMKSSYWNCRCRPVFRQTKSFDTDGNLLVEDLKRIKSAFDSKLYTWFGGNSTYVSVKKGQKVLYLKIYTYPADDREGEVCKCRFR